MCFKTAQGEQMTNLKFMLYRTGLSCLLGLAVIGCSSAVETALDAEFKKMESLFQVDPGAGVRHGREIGATSISMPCGRAVHRSWKALSFASLS